MTTPQDLAAQIEALAPAKFVYSSAVPTFADNDAILPNGYEILVHSTLSAETAEEAYAKAKPLVEVLNNTPAIVAAIRQGEGMVSVRREDLAYLAKLADWASGQGFCQIEGMIDPDEWCYERWGTLRGDDDGYSADALAEALSSAPAPDERDDEVRRLKAQLECIDVVLWSLSGKRPKVEPQLFCDALQAIGDVVQKERAALSPAKGGEA